MTKIELRAALTGLSAPIVLMLILLGLIAYSGHKSQVSVWMSVQSSAPGRLQVFHDAQGHFAEARSVWLDVADVGVDASVDLRGQGAMWLRLDPPAGGVTAVCDLRLSRAGPPAHYEALDATEVSVSSGGTCLLAQSEADARDPKLVLRFIGPSASRITAAGAWYWVGLVAWLALAAVLLRIAHLLRPGLGALARLIPVLPGFGNFHRRAHWVCAAIMLGFGIAYIVVTPPGAVADEEAHLAKVLKISHGVPFGGADATLMPDPREMYGPFRDFLGNKAPFTGEQLTTQLQKPLICEPSTTALATGADGYFPHHYLLPVVAYKLGCVLGVSFGSFLYAARALNLLLATVLVVLGVGCATRGKLGLFLVALLPMSLFQMSSISADSLVMSLSIAWLGVVSGIASGTLRPARAAPLLWSLSLAIAFLKPGSAWILVCLLFCKPAYDAAGESFVAALAKHVVLPWALHIGWTLAVSGNALLPPWADPAAQIQALSADPSGFLKTLAMTFRDKGERLGEMLVGVLGWLDVPLSSWVYGTAALMGLAALWTNDDSPPRMARYVAPLALLAIAGSVVLIALPLFIYWTPDGSPVILGLQGRYFTATAAFALVWCSFRSPLAVRAILAAAIVVGVSAINLDAIQHLHQAYFLTGR